MKRKPDLLNRLFAETIRKNWTSPAFSDYQGESYTYREVGSKIIFLHHFFEKAGIDKGDKIALLGSNSSLWGISYLGILTYGAVVVPILPDFSADSIHHIINHSESKVLIISNSIYEKIDIEKLQYLSGILSLNDFSLIWSKNNKVISALEKTRETTGKREVKPEEIHFQPFDAEDLCMISYTSGTSGFTKGVMLSRRSIASNIQFAQDNMPLQAGDKIVSFLPMAHCYGLLFEYLFPVTLGCHITFLTRVPSPQIVTKAFQEIRPHLILSVPLVIEKIYRKRILPELEKPIIRALLKTPVISQVIQGKVQKKLSDTFGQRFHEVVIGGAPLSEDVEAFFRKIGFRFTIGYGMTECAPLISYVAWDKSRFRSAGKVVDRMNIRIQGKDPVTGIGEIQVKGENLMTGYYKNKEATNDAFTKDGWLKTGDLGYLDKDGYLYIKGRSKNMILGPSGQNIYPEELEAKISALPCVQECVVKHHDDKLIAMIYPDPESISSGKMSFDDIQKMMNEKIKVLNKELPKYEQITDVEITDVEFVKTPKRNIKRYLYT